MSGGVSANATRYDLLLADGTEKSVVVRQLDHAAAEGAGGASQEYRALRLARSFGVAAPAPCYVEGNARIVLEYVEGAPDLSVPMSSSRVDEMVRHLAQIHSVRAAGADLGFLPSVRTTAERMVREQPREPDTSLGEAGIRHVLERSWPWPQRNAEVLLHGDYWPGNLLWLDGRITAVIDWEEAARGDPLADLAITRLDVLWAFGAEAMQALTRRYAELTAVNMDTLAHWDLLVALRPMSNLARWASSYAGPPVNRPDIDEASMRQGHHWFVEQAIERLGAFARG